MNLQRHVHHNMGCRTSAGNHPLTRTRLSVAKVDQSSPFLYSIRVCAGTRDHGRFQSVVEGCAHVDARQPSRSPSATDEPERAESNSNENNSFAHTLHDTNVETHMQMTISDTSFAPVHDASNYHVFIST